VSDKESAAVRVSSAICQGHGLCYAYHPELFEPDEEGFSIVRGAGSTSLAIAQHAESACPERAISIIAQP
jgi:ferredoxin